MIKTIIIDDIQNNRDVLQELLTTHCPNIQICSFAASVAEAYIVIQNIQPDLILLDIEMPPSNAFELLKRFPNPNFEVIFVTAHNQYALRAIKFCALDYLLKPVDIEELKTAIHKVENKIKTNQRQNYTTLIENIQNKNHQEHKIALPTLEGLIFVKVHQIIRCEADGSYTKVHLVSEKTLTATRKIKEFEQLLIEHSFFRVHRSHLINLDKIEKYFKGDGGYVLLSDGSNITISRRKKEEFLEQLNRI